MTLLNIRHTAIVRGSANLHRRPPRPILEAGCITASLPGGVAVVGINGSGKSSLFMLLSGNLQLRSTTSASVAVDGRTPAMASVPQVPALPGWLDPIAVARLHGADYHRMVAELPGLHLDELHGRRCADMSVGQRQVLAIALALAAHAELTLLDEPFSALDFRRRLGVLEALHDAIRSGRRGVMLSSQSAPELVEICHHFVVIRGGRYVFNGPRDELGTVTDVAGIEGRLLRMLA